MHVDINLDLYSHLVFRLQRVQKENKEAEQRKLEAAIEREQKQQEFIRKKEEEVLLLQVRLSINTEYFQLCLKYICDCIFYLSLHRRRQRTSSLWRT